MSTIKFTFSTQALDFAPLTRGQVNIIYNDGVQDYTLFERLTTGTSTSKYFKEVAWVDGISGEDEEQAVNFATAFNRDYKDVGGTKNLVASVSGNEVTITSKTGTFPTGSAYTGNVLVVGSFARVNVTAPASMILAVVRNPSVGNCNTIQYSASVTGGTPNYSLVNGATSLQTNWNGSAATFNLNRGTQNTLTLTDLAGQIINVNINVPRKLAIGEFKERFLQYEGYSDVTIESVNPVFGTDPLQYAITDLGEVTGSDYQTANSFPGVLVGTYLLWVKDAYGCEISKAIEVRDLEDNSVNEIEPFFLIPEENALIFSEKVNFGGDVRKNYFNTTTRNENTFGVRHEIKQSYLSNHVVPTRFLSSYPFHVATLFKCDGTKQNIPVITVQTNLGAKEKIDCVLFNVNGSIGVYFNGGNEYQPDTDTIIGANTIDGGTPDWSNVGQLINLEGLGAKYITGFGYDDIRGYYFTVDGTATDDLASKVQTTYNKQIYNVFDFFLSISDIDTTAKVEVQYGFDFDTILGTHITEVIEKVDDSHDWNLIKWSDEKNRGNMIYQSFPKPFVMLKGKLDILTPNNSETSNGDSKVYSLEQESFLGFSFKAGMLSRKMVNKLTIVSGTALFEINGIPLVKNAPSTFDNIGSTNLKIWTCEFGYSGNQLGIKKNENDVLDVSTGVIGGGNSAKGESVPSFGAIPVFDGKTRYVDSSGNIIVVPGFGSAS